MSSWSQGSQGVTLLGVYKVFKDLVKLTTLTSHSVLNNSLFDRIEAPLAAMSVLDDSC